MASRFFVGVLWIIILAGVGIAGFDAYHAVGAKLRPTAVVTTSPTVSQTREGATPNLQSPSTPPLQDVVATGTLPISTPLLTRPVKILPNVAPPSPSLLFASSTIIASGKLDPSWKSNSWGVTIDMRQKALFARYQNAWSALSFYANGYDLRDVHSFELEFTLTGSSSTDTHDMNHVYVAFYQQGLRLGSVRLMPYLISSQNGFVAHIPLGDMQLKANMVTSVIVESEFPIAISVSGMRFSQQSVESKLVAEVPVAPVGATPPIVTAVPHPIHEPEMYFAGLKNGWVLGSRRATVDGMNEERSITGKAIKVSFDSQTSALSFVQPNGFATKGYSGLRLYVYGGVTDHQWQQLYVTLYDVSGKKLGTVDISTYGGNGKVVMRDWENYDVPLSAFRAEDVVIGTIDIENASVTQMGDNVWVDNVSFFAY